MLIPAPVLGLAYQALRHVADTAADTFSGVGSVSIGGGDIAYIQLCPGADGSFDLSFLDAQGRVVSRFERLYPGAALMPEERAVQADSADQAADQGLQYELRALAAALLKFNPEELGYRDNFHDLGFDSISLTRLAEQINTAFATDISPAIFFEYEHLESLTAYLTRQGVRQTIQAVSSPALVRPEPSLSVPVTPPASADQIAIVGMAARLPGGTDPETFFDKLLTGEDLTRDLPLQRYSCAYAERFEQAGYARRGGFLADIDQFDAALFNISSVEAQRMDPQQRLLLQTAWHAIQHAGYEPRELAQDTGVFVGVSALDYADLLKAHGVPGDAYVSTGNSLAMVANRLSHVLNLRGPSHALDTACSSSLVALLQAADAIRNRHCDAALVGGVNLCLAFDTFQGPHEAGMLSPEGRCKTFGASADGYARGEGVVVLMLKRLTDAQRDGDRVLGLLAGGAENHGGKSGSLPAPNVNAQAELIQQAMQGLEPRSVTYIEAHGTGTHLGDPVEVNGLKKAYASLHDGVPVDASYIGLGTVKSNIGHLEAAAGLAGVVKVLMALQRGELPPSLHCDTVNPHIDLHGSPFRLVRQRETWSRTQDAQGRVQPRRAGISSFGFGGANAHLVLEE